MKTKIKNSREKFEEELNNAINRFDNLEIGYNQDLYKLTPDQIFDMCTDVENANLDLSVNENIEKLTEIISSYENDSRLTVFYDGQAIAKILTNHSLTISDALSLIDIDFTEEENGDPVWDYDLFSFET